MTCGHLYAVEAGLESAFTVDASRVTFGAGSLHEVGDRAASRGARRIALVTDSRMRELPWFADVDASLRAAGLDVAVFDEVAVEPTDVSIEAAVSFARDVRPDAYVSLGGGSVIDTAKLANLLTSHPAPLLDYVNAPLGAGKAVPGPLAPHIACPTTSGTGSEVTGIAIFDLLEAHAKTGAASPLLRPTEAVVDPRVTATLPANVVAASGLDVMCHAVESFTARPFTVRPASSPATARPMSQGANPWSDLGCREAMALIGRYLVRAVTDAEDAEARHHMMWAATLAGIAFGNAGVHVPHAMAYAVAGRVRDYVPFGYPVPADLPGLVPHGFAVAVNAPAAFQFLAHTSPERHREAARLLGSEADLDEAVADVMRDVGTPNGIEGVGYSLDDVYDLVAGAAPQRRLLDNAPMPVHEAELETLFRNALRCW
jgi:hydroxyacid-oxoacid transhydrogenase